MFKKNPSRPTFTINFKKTSQGYRMVHNESFQLFTAKKIVRSIYRPDLIQMSNQNMQGMGNSTNLASGTMIQPPSHVTIPAVASWFHQDQIHYLEKQAFPQFFKDDWEADILSFDVKNANLYLYYRNSMIAMWRKNAKKYLSPSFCRKNLLGDVSAIMRIHAFLQNWGLVNFPSKEHTKGIVISNSQQINCYVCQQSCAKIYCVTEIEDILFQVCSNCFENGFYPQCIQQDEFKKVYLENHLKVDKQMENSQILRMLEIINGIPSGLQKDKQTWLILQKQFPEMTKQQILKIFLKLPLNISMNSHIFENNQDLITIQNEQLRKEIQNINKPSVFEDFENPILGSIAMNYYIWRLTKAYNTDQNIISNEENDSKQNEKYQLLDKIFKSTQDHTQYLAKNQEIKITHLIKMLNQVALSKLELKSLFISQYEKLIKSQQQIALINFKNNLAQNLKINFQMLQREEPEIINASQSEELNRSNNHELQQNNIDYLLNVENGNSFIH